MKDSVGISNRTERCATVLLFLCLIPCLMGIWAACDAASTLSALLRHLGYPRLLASPVLSHQLALFSNPYVQLSLALLPSALVASLLGLHLRGRLARQWLNTDLAVTVFVLATWTMGIVLILSIYLTSLERITR